jgi:tetratricopeptide (TPR) repeat protein
MGLKEKVKILCCLLTVLVGLGCDRPESLMQRGNMAHKQGDKTSAIDFYQRAREHALTRESASYNLGRIYFDSGKFPEAKAMFDEALPLELENPIIRVYRGRAALEMGEKELGESDLRLTARLHPEVGDSHFYLAQLLAERGDYDEALKQMEIAREFPGLREQAALSMAAWYREKGEPLEAVSILEELLSTHGFRYQTYLLLGEALAEAGEFMKAEVFLRRGLALNPGDSEGLFALAKVFEELSKDELARELYKAIIEKREAGWSERAQERLERL